MFHLTQNLNRRLYRNLSEMAKNKLLIALDFDHTIINANSDTFVYQLAPGKIIPPELRNLYKRSGWTHYMGEVFKFLHEHGVTEKQMLSCIENIALTEGMEKLLTCLPKDKTEYIIISDSNSIFIDHILKNKGLKENISAVFTNPAKFGGDGCLKIEKFHKQDWCSLSTNNLCKGHILSDYVNCRALEGINFNIIAYIGDGYNDFCPSLRLRNSDYVFPRLEYHLDKTIPKMKEEKGLELKATIFPWTTGIDIYKVLLPYCDCISDLPLPNPRLQVPEIN